MKQDTVLEYSSLIESLRYKEEPFALATVIRVHGSASARVGSKAIFDRSGKNIFGWVGGGCAERFVGEQAVECIQEERGRVVLADLDDEIFGLGVACGGKMEVFVDPIVPLEKVTLPDSAHVKVEAEELAFEYGLKINWNTQSKSLNNIPELFMQLSQSLARQRSKTGLSLREVKQLPVKFAKMDLSQIARKVTLLGRGRIVESLAKHFSLLSWSVRSFGPQEQQDIQYQPGEIVIIAGHSSRDRQLLQEALEQKPAYVGMICSRKRSLEFIEHLQIKEGESSPHPLFAPAGIDMDAKNPTEIGLSIVAEILQEMGVARWI